MPWKLYGMSVTTIHSPLTEPLNYGMVGTSREYPNHLPYSFFEELFLIATGLEWPIVELFKLNVECFITNKKLNSYFWWKSLKFCLLQLHTWKFTLFVHEDYFADYILHSLLSTNL